MKALLTRHQIEFPKTHVIRRLLILLEPVDPAMVKALDDANWLSPFGAEIRYPGDRAEALPGEEVMARQLAEKVRDAVMAGCTRSLPRWRLNCPAKIRRGRGRSFGVANCGVGCLARSRVRSVLSCDGRRWA